MKSAQRLAHIFNCLKIRRLSIKITTALNKYTKVQNWLNVYRN